MAEYVTNGLTGTGSEAKTGYEYNTRNQLTRVLAYEEGALAGEVKYSYDKVGNLVTMTDGNGNATRYSYDALHRLTELKDPLSQVEKYVYDANSNLIRKVDRNGNTITTTYDGMNRPLKVSAVHSDGTILPETIQTSYTKTGNVLRQTNENLTTDFAYDNHGRNITQTSSNGIVKAYTYTLADTRASFQLKQNGTIKLNQTYQYDAMGRLKETLNNGTVIESYAWDKNGNLVTKTKPGPGMTSTYTYGLANQLTALENKKGTSVLFKCIQEK